MHSCASQEEEIYLETVIDHSALEELRTSLPGAAYTPAEEGYDEGRQAFNLNAHSARPWW